MRWGKVKGRLLLALLVAAMSATLIALPGITYYLFRLCENDRASLHVPFSL